MGFDWGLSTPLSSFKGRFDGWRPPRQSMTSRFGSPPNPVVIALGGDWGVYHVFVYRFYVPQVPWDQQLYVESMIFPTDTPPGAHGGAEIYDTGVWETHNCDFQALRTPSLYEESILCA